MNYLLWTVAFVAAIRIWLAINKRLFNDIASPFNILLLVWVTPLMVKTLHLSSLEKPWSLNVILLTGVTTVILVGVSIAASFWIKNSKRSSEFDLYTSLNKRLTDHRFQIVAVLWYLLGISYYVYDSFITNSGGIPLLTFTQDPNISRDPYWLWTQSGPAAILLSPILGTIGILYLMFRVTPDLWKKGSFLLLVIIYPLMNLAKMSRVDLVAGLGVIAMAEYYYKRFVLKKLERKRRGFLKNLTRRGLIAGIVISLALLSATIFNEIRNGSINGVGTFSKFSDLLGYELDAPEPFGSAILEYYTYFVLPFENLSNFLNSYSGEPRIGVGFLRPIFSVLGLGSVAREKIDDMDFAYELLPANTFPFIAMAYAELGWLGVIVSAFVYAALVNWVYVRFRNRLKAEDLIAYWMCIVTWAWIATNANFTGVLAYGYILFPYFIFWQYKVFFRSSNQYKGIPRWQIPSKRAV